MRPLALLIFLVVASAWADEPPSITHVPPLACPQCGDWDLVTAGFGLAGESIIISPERVEMPVLGSFCAYVLRQTVENNESSMPTYRTTLNLAAGDTCAVPDADSLRMEVLVPGKWQTAGSVIEVAVYRGASPDAFFKAAGWNAMRNDLCNIGGGSPGTDCGAMAHAQTFKRLAYLMYAVQEGKRPREVVKLARRFNVTRFAGAVEAFCARREVESGAGDARFWSMECQNERLDAKLAEWQAWSMCRELSKGGCAMPTEGFDRSKRVN